MVNYQDGKIYKLVGSGLTYVSSTSQRLSKRLYGHKNNFHQYQKGNCRNTTSFQIIERGNVDIVLLEKFPCNTKEELHARERYWIEKLDCVNKIIPTRTNKEY